MQDTIEIIAGAILRNPADKILIIRQKKWDDIYTCFVGGHVIFLEPILSALVREIREETGLSINPSHALPLANGELIRPDKQSHMFFVNFLCDIDNDGASLVLNDEIQDAQWVSASEALGKVMDDNKKVLEDLIAGGKLAA